MLDDRIVHPYQGHSSKILNCYMSVLGKEPKNRSLSFIKGVSTCTDYICESLVSRLNDIKYKKMKRIGLYFVTYKDLTKPLQILNQFEELSNLKKTKLIKFNYKDRYLLIPDKRILKYTILASLYTKLLRNIINYPKDISFTDLKQNDFVLFNHRPDFQLNNNFIYSILFQGKLLDLVKGTRSSSGRIKNPEHSNLGIIHNLMNPTQSVFGKNITKLQQELL